MKRILILSDNLEMLNYIMGLIAKEAAKASLKYSVYCSPDSQIYKLREMRDLEPLDLKDPKQVQFVLDNFELILNVHGKQIIPKSITSQLISVNVHPGYNPYNRGFYSQIFSIINGLPTGVTIHLMDEQIDSGPILVQEEIVVEPWETSKDVYEKIIEIEKRLLDEHLVSIIDGKFVTKKVLQSGNYNSLSKFREICRLDLDHMGTLQDHVNLLRALSHGEFRNAYFLTNDSRKVFIRINLELESDI